MQTKINLFKFQGTTVKLDLLFLLLFLFMPISYAISVFIAVLIHEMAHAWMANRKGYHVYGIEIGLFSGSTPTVSNNAFLSSIGKATTAFIAA